MSRFQYFLPEAEADSRTLEFDCRKRADPWVPPAVYVYRPTNVRGDFYQFQGGLLIAGDRATEALRTQLEMAGELLPLPFEGREYTVLNVTECVNCLDQDATEWAIGRSSGERLFPRKYVFHPSRVPESPFFKIPETCRAELFVAEGAGELPPEEEVRAIVERHGLRGLVFTELWSDQK